MPWAGLDLGHAPITLVLSNTKRGVDEGRSHEREISSQRFKEVDQYCSYSYMGGKKGGLSSYHTLLFQ